MSLPLNEFRPQTGLENRVYSPSQATYHHRRRNFQSHASLNLQSACSSCRDSRQWAIMDCSDRLEDSVRHNRFRPRGVISWPRAAGTRSAASVDSRARSAPHTRRRRLYRWSGNTPTGVCPWGCQQRSARRFRHRDRRSCPTLGQRGFRGWSCSTHRRQLRA